MAEDKEKYDGEYKVGISDQGRVSFNLNWKWVVSIVITIMGFVLYLIIDKYHFQPMMELRKENIELRKELTTVKREKAEDRKAINTLTNNQGILLDRSERTQKFIDMWYTENEDHSNHVEPLEHNNPGE